MPFSALVTRRVVPVLAALVLVTAFPRVGSAQITPLRFGTWKLNLAKSTYGPGLAPKSQTRTYTRVGSGLKQLVEGVAADGSRVSYSYTGNYDGKDYPETGVGMPNGADTIAIERISEYSAESTLKRAGKVVQVTRSEVARDGKLLTLTSTGTNAKGEPTSSTAVFDKQ